MRLPLCIIGGFERRTVFPHDAKEIEDSEFRRQGVAVRLAVPQVGCRSRIEPIFFLVTT